MIVKQTELNLATKKMGTVFANLTLLEPNVMLAKMASMDLFQHAKVISLNNIEIL